jgi:subtilase family serine protease
MTFANTVYVVPVQAPASELWKYVKAYGQIRKNYVDFIDSTTMDDAKLAAPHASSA